MSFGLIIGLAIGGAFLLEGLMWALFPDQMREMMKQMLLQERNTVQTVGLISFVIGAVLIMLIAGGVG